jgi:hypothetical protein
MATPNMFPQPQERQVLLYYQQQADYKIDIELDKKSSIKGSEVITYYNNSDTLEYLWVQLDQNQAANSQTPLAESQRMEQVLPAATFSNKF